MGNVDGRLTGLIYPNEEIEVYTGRDQSIKLFTGKADTITTDSGGIRFKAYDKLALLNQEYITEEYQAEWRDTDVGVIIRAIVADSKWAPDANFIRTDTGVIIEHLNFRWKSRLEAIKRLVELANSDKKRYVLYTDGAGIIHFRRYDDDEWPVAFMTTEDDLGHVVEDLLLDDVRVLLFFEETYEDGGDDWIADETPYENDMEFYGNHSLSGKHQTKEFSQHFDGAAGDYGYVWADSSLDVFAGQVWTTDIVFWPDETPSNHHLVQDYDLTDEYRIRVSSGGTLIEILNTNDYWQWTPSVGWDANQWNYLTLVVDGSDVRLYKNGVLTASTTQSSYDWVGSGTQGLHIARDFHCYVDLFRHSARAFSEAEVNGYARSQMADLVLTDISKVEHGGDKYNHCIVKYSEDTWAQYPDPCPDSPVTKLISTTSERTTHDCYIRAKAIVQSHTQVPTSYKAMAISSRCDYRPNDLVEVYAPRYNIVGQFRLKNMTYTIRDNIRKLSMTLAKEDRELTKLLAIAGL